MKNLLFFLVFIASFYVVFFYDTKTSAEENTLKNSDIKVYIRGLDNFERGDLDIIKSIIEKKYGLNCKVESSITTSYKNNDNKDCDLIQEELGLTNTFTEYDDSEPITIYVTNSKINTKGNDIYGLCYGNSIYVSHLTDFPSFLQKPVLEINVIHELSHSFGMDHCDDAKCLMGGYFDEKGNLPFCEKHMKEALENGFKPNG